MLKLNTLLLIVVLILNCFYGFADPYTQPTDNELLQWWKTLTQEQQIEEIRKLDIIEHTTPDIVYPEYTAILTKNGDLIIMVDPINIKISYLEYIINVDPQKIEKFYEIENKTIIDYFLPVLLCTGSAIIGTALSEKAEYWQYGISALQGMGIGIFLTIKL